MADTVFPVPSGLDASVNHGFTPDAAGEQKDAALIALTLTREHPETHLPITQTMQAPAGSLLSDVLRLHGHSMDTPCGGKRLCGKCRVTARGLLSPVCAEERRALSPEALANGTRLACCVQLLGDSAVTLPGQARLDAIRSTGAMPLFSYMPLFTQIGAAVDIGTTTLAAQLYNASGLLAAATSANPQSVFGADVISRIGQALNGKAALLADTVRTAVASLLQRMEQQAGLAPCSIDTLVITGNTAMLYLLTCQNPDCLSHAPFDAQELFGCFVPADTLGLPCVAGAQVYFPRCISAFVGADITTALLASDICAKPDTALLADIGTNGEMALWHSGQLLCCSTAAGPAFEGAGLSYGMQGTSGAIDHVEYTPAVSQDTGTASLHIHTIGNAPARGLCGSGVVDALAALMQAGTLEESGLLSEEGHALTHLMCAVSGTQNTSTTESAVRLSEGVLLTQQDIRMVQLAKSAVCAGMRTLLHTAKVSPAALRTLAIAGGFGSFLSLPCAAQIGLFPAELLPKAAALGNAALSGAAMLLLNRDFLPKAEAMACAAHTVELSTSPVFLEQYMECMMFDI